MDGIPASELERVNTPFLDKIASNGGYSRAKTGGKKGGFSESPTISAVGYNSLLTGTWANKHQVWGNTIANPNYHYWSVFRFLKEARPESHYAIFSTWQDNRTKLLGENLEATGFLKLDYALDGLELDTLQYPHDEAHDYIRDIDQRIATEAARTIQASGPDLTWVYLQYTDDMGHRFGKSPQLDQAIQLADQQVGLVWEAIQDRQAKHPEDWLLWVTTDHGRKEPEGKEHGGQSDSEREIWMVTNATTLNERFFSEEATLVDIIPSFFRFYEVDLPEFRKYELDGVSLIGDWSFAGVELISTDQQMELVWTPSSAPGVVDVLWSPTNRFAKGKRDRYRKLGEVAGTEGRLLLPSKFAKRKFFKILLRGEKNTGTVWNKNAYPK